MTMLSAAGKVTVMMVECPMIAPSHVSLKGCSFRCLLDENFVVL